MSDTMPASQQRVTEYKYQLRLPSDLGQALQEQAAVEDRPIARVLRQAVREYLEWLVNHGWNSWIRERRR